MTFAKREDSRQGFGGYLGKPPKNPACCPSAPKAHHKAVYSPRERTAGRVLGGIWGNPPKTLPAAPPLPRRINCQLYHHEPRPPPPWGDFLPPCPLPPTSFRNDGKHIFPYLFGSAPNDPPCDWGADRPPCPPALWAPDRLQAPKRPFRTSTPFHRNYVAVLHFNRCLAVTS